MNTTRSDLHAAIVAFCSTIGKDPLLVQGAGGNVSYKFDDELWVKASGTWLADAGTKDIFVPADLAALRAAIAQNEFDTAPCLARHSSLRPSIETMLHALMPQRVVAHVHAIEALVHLVSADCETRLQERLGDFREWILVDYHKPGAPLATAVAQRLGESRDISVVFLRNHGVVVGGESTEEVSALLELLTSRLRSPVRKTIISPAPVAQSGLQELGNGYSRLLDDDLEQLVFDENSYRRLTQSWALYPDHVVFLGPQALVYDCPPASGFGPSPKDGREYPIFILGVGIFVGEKFNQAAYEQLRCYHDVIMRLSADAQTCTLSVADIAGLLDWDAERYRIENAK